MKAVLINIQPCWVFLIIAKKMGWNINQEKTIEVRKNYPKDGNWNKIAKIYCSKDKKSFAKIPNEYQPLMEQLLGKVIGEFVCDNIAKGNSQMGSCLTMKEIDKYANGKPLYGWHISNLVIYDKPKELSEFEIECKGGCDIPYMYYPPCEKCQKNRLKRPPQSWCYVERSETR